MMNNVDLIHLRAHLSIYMYVCRLSHSCTLYYLLKQLDGIRCHLAGILAFVPSNFVLHGKGRFGLGPPVRRNSAYCQITFVLVIIYHSFFITAIDGWHIYLHTAYAGSRSL